MSAAKKDNPGPTGKRISLAPLTPDQALAAALRVKPADVKRLEEQEARAKGGKKKRGK